MRIQECIFRSISGNPPAAIRRDVQGGGAPMRRQFSLLSGTVAGLVVLWLACAGGQSGGATASPGDRQRVQNLVPFNVANCFPSKLDLGKTANEYTLQAAFRGARP